MTLLFLDNTSSAGWSLRTLYAIGVRKRPDDEVTFSLSNFSLSLSFQNCSLQNHRREVYSCPDTRRSMRG